MLSVCNIKFRNRFGIVIMMFALSFNHALAKEIKVDASVDRDSILIGEHVTMTQSVQLPRGFNFVFPETEKLLPNKFEVIQAGKIDSVWQDEFVSLSRQILITCFDSGYFTFKPGPYLLHTNNQVDTLYSKPLQIYVNTVAVDKSKGIKDIRGQLGKPITWYEILFYFAIVLLAAGVTILLIRFLKRDKPVKDVFKAFKENKPAHVIALAELERLKAEKLWQKGLVKEYYTRLTNILRLYLTARYNVHALEMTSAEIMEAITGAGFNDNDLYDQLKGILVKADMVKFAKAEPLATENDAVLLDAFSFVNNTKPIEVNEKPVEPVDKIKE